MKRNKLLLLLALLMTAATGAWATEYTTLAVGDVIKVGDTFTPTADGAFNNDFGVRSGETYTLIRADVDNEFNVTEKTDGAYYVFKYVSIMNPYIHFEKDFAVTAISDGLVVTNIETIKGMPLYTLALHESAAPAPAGYTVSLKDGTEEAENWKAKVGNGELQALPLTGLTGDGTETVTVTYTGTKRVKSVTAVKKAVDNTYLKWEQNKLVATEIPATATKVANAVSDVIWEAGTYVVEGNVTIGGMTTLNGNVELIIKDGAKLTANQISGNSKNLSIFGQANQTGELVVNCDATDAFNDITTLEVHSAKVTATSSQYNSGGFYYIQTFNVYGGSVDAENTGGSGYGIGLNENGSMNIYGGEVKAVGNGNGNAYPFGIRSGNNGATVTVYGGKLWAENADNAALRNTITLKKGGDFTGKIETSDDNSAWAEYTGATTPTTKYVRVGY